jgi:cytochrome c556
MRLTDANAAVSFLPLSKYPPSPRGVLCMMRKIGLALAAVSVVSITAAAAQNVAVIKERQDHFEAMGKAVKEPVKMFKGDAEFDLAKVQEALKIIQEKSALLPALFPDDSKVGEDTEALPAIWENKADVESRFKKLGDDAKAAAAGITDKATFEVQFKDVMGNCGGCHKKYRKEKEKS